MDRKSDGMPDIYIIAGFLGVGKTTLIEGLIDSTDQPLLLIENEVGDRSIDGDYLVKAGQVRVENLLSGCICCSLYQDFNQAIQENQDSEIILIEPTGVAELSRIKASLKEFGQVYAITLVDSDDLLECEDVFGSFYVDQIQAADTLILNERVQSSSEEAKMKLEKMNPHARLYHLNLSQVTLSLQNLHFQNSMVIKKLEKETANLTMETVTINQGEFHDLVDLQAAVHSSLIKSRVHRVKGYAKMNNLYYKIDYAAGEWHAQPVDPVDHLGLVVIWG
ncbi:hypothetical protein HZY91_08780 [Facklamia sp. DSM 111018]|uniref:CobW/HypB/UreG nucleotide-binding domain-containing protein n=1 Tax=Facklamia lactis TaxID=2749967 RepID=A0ABS0LS43_9LACT|nr:GTP-binding protein [Facklamia lactis]MBG9986980.1 hypothetical protein [Facklamia lactis]